MDEVAIVLKIYCFFLLLISCHCSSLAWADELENTNNNSSSAGTQKIELNHGKKLTYDQIASVTDIKSARDQSGNPITLDQNISYTIGSFTRTTISLVPPNGGIDDEITLDLIQKQINPSSGQSDSNH